MNCRQAVHCKCAQWLITPGRQAVELVSAIQCNSKWHLGGWAKQVACLDGYGSTWTYLGEGGGGGGGNWAPIAQISHYNHNEIQQITGAFGLLVDRRSVAVLVCITKARLGRGQYVYTIYSIL